jgi:hypothetical protein
MADPNPTSPAESIVTALCPGYAPSTRDLGRVRLCAGTPAFDEPSSIHPVVHLQADRPAHDRYRITYVFFGGDGGEIIQPTEDEAWALWNVVRAAHARDVR